MKQLCGKSFFDMGWDGSTEFKSPQCVEALYDLLDRENALDWQYAIAMTWKSDLLIAFWWYSLFFQALGFYIYSLANLENPNAFPNINDVPSEGTKKYMLFLADVIKPDFFFWSYIFTLGNTKLKDFELLYMTPT